METLLRNENFIGDIMLDEWIYGSATKKSAERQ